MNDDELYKLKKYLEMQPTDLDIKRWQKVLRRKQDQRQRPAWQTIVASVLIGFVLGAASFHGPTKTPPEIKEKIIDDATFEHVYIKDN